MDISWTKLKFNIKQTNFSFDIKHFVIEKSNTCIKLNLYFKTFLSIISLQLSESTYLNKFCNMMKLLKTNQVFDRDICVLL